MSLFEFVGMMFTAEVVFFSTNDPLMDCESAFFARKLKTAQLTFLECFHFLASFFLR